MMHGLPIRHSLMVNLFFIFKSSYICFSHLCHVETAPLSSLQT